MKRRLALIIAALSVVLFVGCIPVTHRTTPAGVSYCSRTQGIDIDEFSADYWYATVYALVWMETDGDECNEDGISATVAAGRLGVEIIIYRDGVACGYSPLKWNTSSTDSHSGFTSCREAVNDGDTHEFLAEVKLFFKDGAGNIYEYQGATVAAEF